MALPTLTKITFDKCPECDCANIGDVRLGSGSGLGTHSCGEWREFITFRCGSEYEYSPNFGRIVCNKICRKAGVNEATVDVTVRLTLKVPKDTDLSKINLDKLIQVPGDYSAQAWQRSSHSPKKAAVTKVVHLRTGKIKKLPDRA